MMKNMGNEMKNCGTDGCGRCKIKMLGLDLDGTVLNNNKQMNPAVAEAIEAAAAAGIVVVPVTGRPLSGIPKNVLGLKGVRYAITSNGSVVVDLEKGEVVEGHYFSRDVATSVVKLAMEQDCIYSMFVNGYGYSTDYEYNRIMEMYRPTPLASYVEDSRAAVEDIWAFMDQPTDIRFSEQERKRMGACKNGDCVENLWVTCDDPKVIDIVETTMREIDPTANVVRMQDVDVEMVALGADKGAAFLHLAEAYGFSKEETMAIGDSFNDVGFMKKAGLSVAMGNASEMIKELADYVTDDNEHDGVAAAIKKFCL